MIIAEFKVNACADREKLIIALVNSGYTVRVEERKNPTWNHRLDYYVQVLGGPQLNKSVEG